MRIVFSVLTAVLLISCTKVNKKNTILLSRDTHPTTVIAIDPTQTPESFNLSEVADSAFIIPLETRDECLIDGISWTQVTDDRIFISGGENSLFPVYVFNKTGQFLNRIGVRGRGPGELISPQGFTVDAAKKEVDLYDDALRKHFIFDYNGVFLRDVKNNIYCVDHARVEGDINAYFSCFQTNTPEADGNNYEVIVADKSGKRIGLAFPYTSDRYADGCISIPFNFSSHNESLYFFKTFNDTIYSITPTSISPRFIFDFGKYGAPKDIWTSKYSAEQRLKLSNDPNIISGPFDFIHVGNNLYFNFIYGRFGYTAFYNLSSGKLIASTIVENDLNGLLLLDVVGNDDQYIYFSLRPNILKMYRDDLLNRGKTPSQQLSSLVEKYNESSNPLLLCIRMKDSPKI